MAQGAAKLQESKAGGPKKMKTVTVRRPHKIGICKGGIKIPGLFFGHSNFTSWSLAAPWATRMPSITLEGPHNFWMVQYLFKSIAALLFSRSDIRYPHSNYPHLCNVSVLCSAYSLGVCKQRAMAVCIKMTAEKKKYHKLFLPVTNWLSFRYHTISAFGLAFDTLQVSSTSSFSRIFTRLPGVKPTISILSGGTVKENKQNAITNVKQTFKKCIYLFIDIFLHWFHTLVLSRKYPWT